MAFSTFLPGLLEGEINKSRTLLLSPFAAAAKRRNVGADYAYLYNKDKTTPPRWQDGRERGSAFHFAPSREKPEWL